MERRKTTPVVELAYQTNHQEITRQAIEALAQNQAGRTHRCYRNRPLWPHWADEPRLTHRQIRKQRIARYGVNGS